MRRGSLESPRAKSIISRESALGGTSPPCEGRREAWPAGPVVFRFAPEAAPALEAYPWTMNEGTRV